MEDKRPKTVLFTCFMYFSNKELPSSFNQTMVGSSWQKSLMSYLKSGKIVRSFMDCSTTLKASDLWRELMQI
jgi:hypothetical protein